MTIEELKINLSEIGKALRLNISDSSNGNELTLILSEMLPLLSLSADTKARSEVLLNNELAKLIESGKYDKYPASDRKFLRQRDCSELTELYNKSENYNKELHYRIEALRTMISNAKEIYKNEMRNA
jgi:hypothetical protein